MTSEKESAEAPEGEVGSTEVPAKPQRRRFTVAEKLEVLAELDAAPRGGVGLILRRRGLYSSTVSGWRRALAQGAASGLERKRGRKRVAREPSAERKVRALERENARLREQLRKAEVVIDVQGKLAGLLGLSPQDGGS